MYLSAASLGEGRSGNFGWRVRPHIESVGCNRGKLVLSHLGNGL